MLWLAIKSVYPRRSLRSHRLQSVLLCWTLLSSVGSGCGFFSQSCLTTVNRSRRMYDVKVFTMSILRFKRSHSLHFVCHSLWSSKRLTHLFYCSYASGGKNRPQGKFTIIITKWYQHENYDWHWSHCMSYCLLCFVLGFFLHFVHLFFHWYFGCVCFCFHRCVCHYSIELNLWWRVFPLSFASPDSR